MKVLVDEIELKDLEKLKKHFITDEEMTFIDYCDKELAFYDECQKPFYVEENIKDIDKVLQLCEDVSWNRTPIRQMVSWNEFTLFWKLILEIKKQRDVGYKIDDINYVYIKIKDNVNVELVDANMDIEEPKLCIVGNSKLGKMTLYKQYKFDDEFVFQFEYEKINILGKATKKISHFHPDNYIEAIKDALLWMNNDENLGKDLGIK